MIAGTLEIQLMANVARLQSDMAAVKASVGNATSAIENMAEKAKAALGGIGGAVGLQGLVAMTDQYTKFTAQLQMASTSASGYAKSLEDVRRISAAAQADLQVTGTLYARISKATEELGVSQRQVSSITEAVALALKASGATTEEAASATLQLSQAFGSGVLRGEEFNAVNEASPRLMKALADGMGVPVGQLRNMATEGKLTAEVMAVALPKSLDALRVEATKVQTISGAFQVLKNNVMEMVGASAQSSGGVNALTTAIGLLANNLTLISGVVATVATAKLASWIAEGSVAMYAQVAASRAAAAATLTKAQADAAATASSVALTTARVAELRSAVTAASGDVALAVATNGLIPAHARAAAAAEAHTVALAALSVAQRGASVSAGVAGGAMALLGGPVGAIVTVLGLAATAWSLWGNSAKDESNKAAAAIGASGAEINATLDSQILKLQQRIALANGGDMKLAKDGGETAELQAKRLAEINALKAKGNALTLVEMPYLYEIQGRYDETAAKVRQVAVETGKLSAIGEKSKAAEWAEKYATKTQQMTKELEAYKLAVGAAYDPKIEAQIRDRYKETAKAATAEEKAFAKFSADAAKREALLNAESDAEKSLTETQKWALEVMVLVRDGKLGESDAERKLIGEIVASQLARESLTRAEKDAEEQRKEHTAAMLAEIDAQAAVSKGITDSNKSLRDQTAEIGLTADALVALKIARVDDAIAIEQARIAGMASASQNSVEADAIRETIAALEDRKVAMQENDRAQKAAEAIKTQGEAWKSIEDTAHQTFVSIFDSGKSAFDRLKDTLENGLLDLLYQMTLKKWIVQISASVSGEAAAESAFGSGSSGLGSLSNLGSIGNSAYNYFTGDTGTLLENGLGLFSSASTGAGITAGAGTAAYVGMGEAVGAGVVAGMEGAVGAGLTLSAGTGVGAATAATAGMGAIGATGAGVSGGLAAGGAATAGLAAVPVAGWVALAAIAAYSIFGGKDAGPKYEGNYFGVLDNAGGSKSQQYATWWSHGTGYSGDSADGQLAQMAPSLTTAINGLVTSLGGTAAGIGVNYGFNHDDSGGANDQISTVVSDSKGNIAYENSYSMDSGGYKDALALEMQRMTLGAIKAADGIKPIFKELVDGIDLTAASAETITKAISDLQGIVTLRAAFENLNLDADGLSMSLISASGGVSALSSSLEGYYSAYFSETEKAQNLTDSLTKSFAAMGLAVPDSKEAFRSLVEGLDLTTTSGQATFAGLMSVNQAFAQMTKATAALTADTKKLEIELLKAQGFTEPARLEQRNIDTAGMTAAEVAIYDYNAALRDQISATNAAAAAAQSQASASADAAAAAAQAQAEAAAAVASERSGLQAQLDTALGNTTAIRARELAALDASNRAIQTRIWAIEDEKAAIESAKATLQSAYSALESSVGAQKTALQTALSNEKSAISARLKAQQEANTAQVSAAQTAATGIRSIADALGNAVKSAAIQSGQYDFARLQSARALLSGAQGVPALDQVPGLTDALATVGKDNAQYYSSFEDYAFDQGVTAGVIEDLRAKAQAQLATAESIVSTLTAQNSVSQLISDAETAAAEQRSNDEIAKLDETLAAQQAQMNAALGINTSVLSVYDAVLGVQSAIATLGGSMAAQTAAVTAATAASLATYSGGSAADLDANQRSVNSMYSDDALRKTADASIVKDYDALRAAGVNMHLLDYIKERTGQSLFNADAVSNTRSLGLSAIDQQAVSALFSFTTWGNGAEFTYSALSDSLGANYTNEQMVSALAKTLGKTEDEIRSKLPTEDEIRGKVKPNGSHASGLERVPYDGYLAETHAGEAIVDAPATAALTRYFGGTGNARGSGGTSYEALIAEMAALRAVAERQAAQLEKITQNTGKSAEILDNNTAGGGPSLVRIVG